MMQLGRSLGKQSLNHPYVASNYLVSLRRLFNTPLAIDQYTQQHRDIVTACNQD